MEMLGENPAFPLASCAWKMRRAGLNKRRAASESVACCGLPRPEAAAPCSNPRAEPCPRAGQNLSCRPPSSQGNVVPSAWLGYLPEKVQGEGLPLLFFFFKTFNKPAAQPAAIGSPCCATSGRLQAGFGFCMAFMKPFQSCWECSCVPEEEGAIEILPGFSSFLVLISSSSSSP